MGISLTWKREDRIKFGDCGKYLDDIVYFIIPASSRSDYSEFDVHCVLNNTEVIKEWANGLELPTYKTGYAILFRESRSLKSRAEIESIFWDIEKDIVPKNAPNRYELIASSVANEVPEGQLELVFSDTHYDFVWNVHRDFVRWISEKDYKEMAVKVREIAESGEHDVDFITRLDLMTEKEEYSICKGCPISIEPEQKVKTASLCYYGSSIGSFGLFFEYISRFGNFSVLTNEYILRNDEEMQAVSEMIESAEQNGYPIEDISDFKSVIQWGEISADELGALEKELQLSRDILESKEYSAMTVFDRKGEKIDIVHKFYYGFSPISHGYRINVSNEKSALTLEYTGPNIFDIPDEAALDFEQVENVYIFYLSDIYRKDSTFIGRFKQGAEMDLPLIKVEHCKETPFRWLDNVENIGRVEHTLISSMDEYGYFQRLFEKYAAVANKFKIPIQFK